MKKDKSNGKPKFTNGKPVPYELWVTRKRKLKKIALPRILNKFKRLFVLKLTNFILSVAAVA